MPILHIQFSPPLQPDGSPYPQPLNSPALVLQQRGPILQVQLTVLQSMAQQLVQQGHTLPDPVSGLALIDTGASNTCIDDAAATQLQLPVIDTVTIASASHAASLQNVYPATLDIAGLQIPINVERAIGAPLAAQGLIALIGRDVLIHGTFIYNGFTGSITFAI